MTSSYSKYRNRKVTVDNVLFHSIHESERYRELVMLQSAGLISELELQPVYPLTVNNVKIGKYIADFRYLDTETGLYKIEDAKGFSTQVYKLKKKLVRAIYNIEVMEV